MSGLTLKRYTAGQWFDYPKATGVRFKIRPLPLSEGLEIRSKVRKRALVDVPDPTGKGRRTVPTLMEDVDTSEFTKEIFYRILVDFEGINVEGENGEPLTLSKDEIKRVIFDDSDIRDFVTEQSEKLREAGEKRVEEEVKN